MSRFEDSAAKESHRKMKDWHRLWHRLQIAQASTIGVMEHAIFEWKECFSIAFVTEERPVPSACCLHNNLEKA
jgi:hypothetical protein